MHYGDKKQTQENILKLVVYTHGCDFGTMPIVESIQECKYFSPSNLVKIINHPYNYIDKDQIPGDEEWYLITFKQIDFDKVEVISVETISNHENEFYKLH